MGLGYDASPAISYPYSQTTENIFSIADAAVAGVISKITIAFRISCSEATGKNAIVYAKYQSGSTWVTLAGETVAENDPTWHYRDAALSPTGLAWTWAEIDGLMAGVRATVVYGGWVNLLQFKVQVTYTPVAYVQPMKVWGNVAAGAGSMMI
jgi:hypothetical protein